MDGYAAHGHSCHVFAEGVDGEDGVVLGIVDDNEEGDFLIGGIDAGDEVVGVVGDPFFLDLDVQDDAF